jgi:hypothetical protein
MYYTQLILQRVFNSVGVFEYEKLPADGVKRILKDLAHCEDGSQYYGFW